MRPLEHRLVELEAKLEAAVRAQSPIKDFLGGLSIPELRVLEQLAARLADEGLELGLRPIDPLTREDIARMTPRERADAYRQLIRKM